jgi:hypothetical protein
VARIAESGRRRDGVRIAPIAGPTPFFAGSVVSSVCAMAGRRRAFSIRVVASLRLAGIVVDYFDEPVKVARREGSGASGLRSVSRDLEVARDARGPSEGSILDGDKYSCI